MQALTLNLWLYKPPICRNSPALKHNICFFLKFSNFVCQVRGFHISSSFELVEFKSRDPANVLERLKKSINVNSCCIPVRYSPAGWGGFKWIPAFQEYNGYFKPCYTKHYRNLWKCFGVAWKLCFIPTAALQR